MIDLPDVRVMKTRSCPNRPAIGEVFCPLTRWSNNSCYNQDTVQQNGQARQNQYIGLEAPAHYLLPLSCPLSTPGLKYRSLRSQRRFLLYLSLAVNDPCHFFQCPCSNTQCRFFCTSSSQTHRRPTRKLSFTASKHHVLSHPVSSFAPR